MHRHAASRPLVEGVAGGRAAAPGESGLLTRSTEEIGVLEVFQKPLTKVLTQTHPIKQNKLH